MMVSFVVYTCVYSTRANCEDTSLIAIKLEQHNLQQQAQQSVKSRKLRGDLNKQQ